MIARAYYNEIDPKAAAWLRELIKQGLIAPGDVDERDIQDVTPGDLIGYRQCHFFAGIGVWSYALRRAGWADDRQVWTGSCPCQPFSAAGKHAGFTDERHLWPAFYHLIEQCKPRVVFGEQVASALGWLDLVQTDLEAADYSVGQIDLCAAGVGAPHIRQRAWFVADSVLAGRAERWPSAGRGSVAGGGGAGALAHPNPSGPILERSAGLSAVRDPSRRDDAYGCSEASVVGRPDNSGPQGHGRHVREHDAAGWQVAQRHNVTAGFWHDADWLPCRDGKSRPVEPGTFPLAHGAPARVGRLRGYGNAIVAPVAQAFIEAYLGVTE